MSSAAHSVGADAVDDRELVVEARVGARGCTGCPAAPAFGSAAPNTTPSSRAAHAAPAHIGHGSSVTTSTHSSSRQLPERGRGVAEREDLGVSGRVAGELALVVTTSNDLAGRRRAATTAPIGTSPCPIGPARLLERQPHELVEHRRVHARERRA